MRCPSCGTENEPDSRFCGGCGARLPTESRLAPTQKIDTGAQPVQSPAHLVGHRTPSQEPRGPSGQQNVPPASYPLTPSVQRNPSKPQSAAQPVPTPAPTNGASPVAAQSMQPTKQERRPKLSAESIPIPAPKRRIGLIIVVLLVDLALAGAGAWMLAEGLSSSSPTPSPSPAPAAGSASPAPAPAGSSAALGSATPAVAIVPDAGVPDALLDAAIAVAEPDAGVKKSQSRNKKKTRKVNNKAPLDPYDEGPSDPFPPDLTPPPPPPPQ